MSRNIVCTFFFMALAFFVTEFKAMISGQYIFKIESVLMYIYIYISNTANCECKGFSGTNAINQ